MSLKRIGIAGAGTMGAGIAQLACLGGFEAYLYDPIQRARAAGAQAIRDGLTKGAERGRWSSEDAEAALDRLWVCERAADLAGCQLLIEAAPEDLEIKRALFASLADVCGEEAILATNTSSLLVAAMASAAPRPERICGMHFFNPPPLMKLVEIVAAPDTSEATLASAEEVAAKMDRTPIRAADGPGFLANRLARPFTLEALRLLGEGVADVETIDRVCRVGGGFRMGPFELMDLVGIDVGFEVAKSFYEQSFHEPRWRPHPIQARMAASGHHGRKSGRGYYDYSAGPHRPPDPDLDTARPIVDDDELADVAGAAAPAILGRISTQIVNEAAFALEAGVGSAEDADTAMRLGFNWPLGPVEWSERLDLRSVVELLDEQRALRGEAYRPAPLLRRAAESGTSLRDIARG
ncbi:MAG: 3-hydroxybutyryl-CoA dehydrogenase [Solirubrobacterales bacterium]|jgi:3-hydroxybutyryl-CoA dehydrogenase|nr:3-hydroxybutyryl-CoA dehydrogenase [Solirubrobacterales bacterium]